MCAQPLISLSLPPRQSATTLREREKVRESEVWGQPALRNWSWVEIRLSACVSRRRAEICTRPTSSARSECIYLVPQIQCGWSGVVGGDKKWEMERGCGASDTHHDHRRNAYNWAPKSSIYWWLVLVTRNRKSQYENSSMIYNSQIFNQVKMPPQIIF